MVPARYTVCDLDDLGDDLADALFVSKHPHLPMRWIVESLRPTYRRDLSGVIGPYLDVATVNLESLLDATDEQGYRVVFTDDPAPALRWVDSLNDHPGVNLHSDFPGTVGGLLPFQVHGLNFSKNLRCCLFNWGTGSGKGTIAIGWDQWHRQEGNYDAILHVVKKHNKVNFQRKLRKTIDRDSIVIDGAKAKREKLWHQAIEMAERGEQPTVVLGYESAKFDGSLMEQLVENRKLAVVFDEMPTKLKTRSTDVWKAWRKILYRGQAPKAGCERPSEVRFAILSATPIENSPDDVYSCIYLTDPDVLGPPAKFYGEFTLGEDVYGNKLWDTSRLDRLGRRLSHMVHQVDKSDPEIAAQFPRPEEEVVEVDLHPDDRAIYDALASEFENMKLGEFSELDRDEILGAINVLSMICSNSLSVLQSAALHADWRDELRAFLAGDPTEAEIAKFVKAKKRGSEVAFKLVVKLGAAAFSDVNPDGTIRSSKLLKLHDLVIDEPKSVVFTRMNDTMIPRLSEHLTSWGLDHVVYHGGLSTKQRQAAQDRFKEDPNCRIFLSSDAGSDSIDLEEAALAIHWDLPHKWSTLTQRQNRISRLTSTHEVTRFVRLVSKGTYEGRMQYILDIKENYHNAVFKGEIADQSQTMRERDAFFFALTGKMPGDD